MPEQWLSVRTPLQPRGMHEGFRVGFKYGKKQCQSATVNMKSATDNPTVVAEYLEKERLAGRVIGPVRREDWPKVQVNRFGVIPKPHHPGKWRLIVDLSHPKGKSVNDGIEALSGGRGSEEEYEYGTWDVAHQAGH